MTSNPTSAPLSPGSSSAQQPVSDPQVTQLSQSEDNIVSPTPTKKSKTVVITVVVLLLIMGGGVGAFFTLRQLSQPESVTQQQSKAYEAPAAPSPITTLTSPSPIPETSSQSSGSFGESIQSLGEIPEHYTGTQLIDLNDLRGGNFSGTASRNIDESSILTTVNANLPESNLNEIYGVWVLDNKGDKIPIGQLEKKGSGYEMISTVQITSNTPAFAFEDLYNTVVVSIENQDNETIETKILQGTFTQ